MLGEKVAGQHSQQPWTLRAVVDKWGNIKSVMWQQLLKTLFGHEVDETILCINYTGNLFPTTEEAHILEESSSYTFFQGD